MRRFHFQFIGLALGLTLSAQAQFPGNSRERETLNIIQTEAATFPLTLANTTVLSGDVKVAVDIDQMGQLTDYLVTSYSRKEFADSAVAALKKWRFEPPLFRGEPWATVQEIRFDYSRSGVVVSLTAIEALNARLDELMERRLAYRTFKLRELDRIPTPIKVVSPAASALGPTAARRSVTVEFYIDQEGRVRLPSVNRAEAATVDATNAIAAVRQWRFEPPLRNGRPVLVIAQQQFNFVPKPEGPGPK